jgi:hypothetical protein
MKARLLCVIACVLLSMTLSPVAAAEAAARPGTPSGNGKPAPAREPTTASGNESQQTRMKRCNEEAKRKELKGEERRGFMSTCLKGDSPTPVR